MLQAFAWGVISASSLLVGAWLAMRFSIGQRTQGLVMAFAAGVLISAVAYELVLVAVEEYDAIGAAGGLTVGALVFFFGNDRINAAGGRGRKSAKGPQSKSPLPIVLGTVLDGVPESAVLGLTLLNGGIGVTMLAAVFLSNFPESLAATTGLRKEGWSASSVMVLWGAVVVVSAAGSTLGYGLFEGAPPSTVAFVLAFAAGAILTMLADTMMPEAFANAGPLVGLVTTLGFAAAFAIQALD